LVPVRELLHEARDAGPSLRTIRSSVLPGEGVAETTPEESQVLHRGSVLEAESKGQMQTPDPWGLGGMKGTTLDQAALECLTRILRTRSRCRAEDGQVGLGPGSGVPTP
jgi:hypothetical protein